MLSRKVLVAFYTSLLAVVGLNLFDPVPSADGGSVTGILVYSIYVVPIIFIYGITSSIISDGISRKANKYKESVSLGLHALFGVGFILPYSLFFEYHPFPELSVVNVVTHPITIFGALCSILFFAIDYILRKKNSLQKSTPA